MKILENECFIKMSELEDEIVIRADAKCVVPLMLNWNVDCVLKNEGFFWWDKIKISRELIIDWHIP